MRRLPTLWESPAEALMYITLLLFLIGTVNIFSASFVLAGQEMHDSYFFLKRHIISFVIGLVGMFVVMRMDYRKLQRHWPIIVLAVIAILLAVQFAGVDANGARRWLKIGFIKFQPSEFAKLAVIIMVAADLGRYLDRGLKGSTTLMSWPVLCTLFVGYLVLRQPDMGTAVVIVGLCLLLYIFVGISLRQLYALCLAGAGGIVYLVYAAAYRAERISAWLNPWAYQQTVGYQTVQSLLAIGSGGFFGTGLGMGASKFHYLPEAHTDFAFAVLCQELGFAGAAVVLALLLMYGWYGVKIALKAQDGFGILLAIGANALVIGQAVGNIAMVSGLIPVTGVPLPFISFGGTSLMVNLLATGLLISVGRRSLAISQQPPPELQDNTPKKLRLVTRGKAPESRLRMK